MKSLELKDKEVLTLPDYPIHDLKGKDRVIIKLYFRMFQKGCGNIVPPVVVMYKNLIVPAFNEDVKNKFNEFEKNNPDVKYIALEGNHRTTAASLTKSRIPAMLIESDKDCKEIQELFFTGEVFREYKNSTLQEYFDEINNLFSSSPNFYTVYEKTKKMVEDDEIGIPSYMKDSFTN